MRLDAWIEKTTTTNDNNNTASYFRRQKKPTTTFFCSEKISCGLPGLLSGGRDGGSPSALTGFFLRVTLWKASKTKSCLETREETCCHNGSVALGVQLRRSYVPPPQDIQFPLGFELSSAPIKEFPRLMSSFETFWVSVARGTRPEKETLHNLVPRGFKVIFHTMRI